MSIKIYIIIALIGYLVYQKFFQSKGQQALLILDQLINQKRVFIGTYTVFIKQEEDGKKIYFPKFKSYYDMPEGKYIAHSIKGRLVFRAVDDGTSSLHFVEPDSSMYGVKKIKYEEPLIKDGKAIMHTIPVTRNNRPVFEDAKIKGRIVYFDGKNWMIKEPNNKKETKVKKIMNGLPETDFETKQLMQEVPKTETKWKEERSLLPYEQMIQTNIKTYFVNKTHELKKKFSVEKKTSIWEKLAPAITAGMIILLFFYVEGKQHREWMSEELAKNRQFIMGNWDNFTPEGEGNLGYAKLVDLNKKIKGEKYEPGGGG